MMEHPCCLKRNLFVLHVLRKNSMERQVTDYLNICFSFCTTRNAPVCLFGKLSFFRSVSHLYSLRALEFSLLAHTLKNLS